MKKNVQFGRLQLSDASPIVIANVSDVDSAGKAAQYADAIEIRCDLVISKLDDQGIHDKNVYKEHLVAIVKEIKSAVNGLPLLATIRKATDTGEWYSYMGNDTDRLNLFRSIYEHVHAVDIEEDAEEVVRETVLREAKDKGLMTILSYHDFSGTETKDEINETLNAMAGRNADVLKMAYQTWTAEDAFLLFKVLGLYMSDESKSMPLSMIGMGEKGKYTRLAFPFFGSCITYGYWDKPKAPGQLRIKDIKDFFASHQESLPVKDQASAEKILSEVVKKIKELEVKNNALVSC